MSQRLMAGAALAVLLGLGQTPAAPAALLEIDLDSASTLAPNNAANGVGAWVLTIDYDLNLLGGGIPTLLNSLGFSGGLLGPNPLRATPRSSVPADAPRIRRFGPGLGVCNNFIPDSPGNDCKDADHEVDCDRGDDAVEFSLTTAPAGFKFFLVAVEIGVTDATDDFDLLVDGVLLLDEVNVRTAADQTAAAYKGFGYGGGAGDGDCCTSSNSQCWIDLRDLLGNKNGVADFGEKGTVRLEIQVPCGWAVSRQRLQHCSG